MRGGAPSEFFVVAEKPAVHKMFAQDTTQATTQIFNGAEQEKALLHAQEVADEADVLDDVNEAEELEGGAPKKAAAKNASKSRNYFNIVDVHGAELPSENARFGGNTPSVAASKAARRIWKRTGKKSFTIIMRKVAKVTTGRDMYKYDVTVQKRDNPIAFFTAKAANIKNTDGAIKQNVVKRVHVAPTSEHPVYGYVGEAGELLEGQEDLTGYGLLHRPKGTNTLILATGKNAMPQKVGPIPVNVDDHQITVKRSTPSDSERNTYDVAGAAKQSAKEAEKAAKTKKKEKEREQKQKEAEKEKARKLKEKQKEAERKRKEADKKQKEREQAASQKAKAAASKKASAPRARGSKRTTGGSAGTISAAADAPEAQASALDKRTTVTSHGGKSLKGQPLTFASM